EGYDRYDPITKWGAGSGIFRTTDGGRTFKKVTAGLPTCPLGRIGLDYYRKDPKVVFAVVDCEKIGMGTPPSRTYLGISGEDAADGVRVPQVSPETPAGKAGLQADDVIQAVDKKEVKTQNDLAKLIREHEPGDKVTLTVLRGKETKEVVLTLERPPGSNRPYN